VELLNLEKYKAEIHRTLISKLDLEKLSRVNSSQARQAVSGIVKEIIADQRVPLNFDEQEKIQADLLDEVFGLGPLEPLLRDPKISDILVNDKDHVFIEKGGLLQQGQHVVPRRSPPAADHRPHRFPRGPQSGRVLADGRCPPARRLARERHHSAAGARRTFAVHPPLRHRPPGRQSTGGAEEHLGGDDGSAASAVKARISIVISGGTGSGKTTLLNILSQYIPNNERLVTIEDAAELRWRRKTSCAWKPGRRTLKGTAPSSSANCSSTACVCAPTASSWARSAAKKPSTCCRP
jgi:pilus assembly protein CpaF